MAVNIDGNGLIALGGTASTYSTVVLSSPLVFNFTTSQTVRLANGTEVPNQRFLFLVL